MPIHDPATLEKFRQAATACRAANRMGHHQHHPQPPPSQLHGGTVGLTPAVGVVAAVSRSPCPGPRPLGQPSGESAVSHGHRTSSVTAETAFHHQHHNHHHHHHHQQQQHQLNSILHNHACASVDEDHHAPSSGGAADSKRRVFRRRKTFSAEPAPSSSSASRWLQMFPVKFSSGGSSSTATSTAASASGDQEGPVPLLRTSQPHPPSEDDDEPGMGSDVEAKLLQRRRHPSDGDQLSSSTTKRAVIRPTIIGVGREHRTHQQQQQPSSSVARRSSHHEPGVVLVGRTNVGVSSPVSSSSPDSGRHSRDTPLTGESKKIDQETAEMSKFPLPSSSTTASNVATNTSVVPPLSPPPDYQSAIAHSPSAPATVPCRMTVCGPTKSQSPQPAKRTEDSAMAASTGAVNHHESMETRASSSVAPLTGTPAVENEDESLIAGLVDVLDDNEAEHCPLATATERIRQPSNDGGCGDDDGIRIESGCSLYR
jgi:hypothetical protein